MSTSTSAASYEQYYRLLDLKPGATEKDVSTAYRLKALRLHPDKNRDDPLAQQKFHQLSEAYQILSDPEARRAYDDLLRLRREREERRGMMDVKRRAMQDELLERERAAKRVNEEREEAEEALRARIDRLREAAQRARQGREMNQALNEEQGDYTDRTLLVTTAKPITRDDLEKLLRTFDPGVIVKDDTNTTFTALFSGPLDAQTVYQTGPSHLRFTWLGGGAKRAPAEQPSRPRVTTAGKIEIPKEAASKGFEAGVLEKMRLAQAKRKQQQSTDGSDNNL